MRNAFTLPPKYLFKLGIEPWKPNAVKNTGLAEIIKALSIGVAIKLSNLISGNIKLNTTAKAASIAKNNTRLILSTLCVPMTINEPKITVNNKMLTLSPKLSGNKSFSSEPPPLI